MRRIQWRHIEGAGRLLSTSAKKEAPKKLTTRQTVALVGASLTTGFYLGRQSNKAEPEGSPSRVLPSGLPRGCCSCDEKELSPEQKELKQKLTAIVGRENVLDGRTSSRFLRGARLGHGTALCVVTPTRLQEVVLCVKAIVNADCVVLPQGANTGLTGGSVPRDDIDRPIVIINMAKHLDAIFPIDKGERVVCLGGAGIASLSESVQEWCPGRESHSILGSTFLNPTTAAGVALGSGGTQLRKGPAYTDRAMYIEVAQSKFGDKIVKVVNTLGVDGLDDEEFEFDKELPLENLDSYQQMARPKTYTLSMAKTSKTKYGSYKASDSDYGEQVCECNDQVARFNADTKGMNCNRSEGKVLILATVHDTFPKPAKKTSLWVSFDSLDTALRFRREVCLDNAKDLPVSVEYVDRDAFDVIDRSGRVLGNVIKFTGPTSPLVRAMWNIKLWIEGNISQTIVDSALHAVNPIVPAILPSPIMESGRKLDDHICMTVGDYDGSHDRVMARMDKFVSENSNEIVIHKCENPSQVDSLTAFRFVAAPAFRTWCVGEGVQGISVDYALPKNGGQAPVLAGGAATPLKRMRYSHFGCNVVHEDIAYGPEVDVHKEKMTLKKSVEHKSGGKLPAEHGHGTEYVAPKETQERWKRMDPLNVMNPGVGGTSAKYKYAE